MSKNVVLTLESRFMDEYGEYANLPVFNAHGSIVGYVGGEVPESGNPCEFNRLNDEGFTFCASATEVVRLKADNAKLRELAAKMAEALRVGGEWCDRECIVVFGCDGMDECPVAKELRELRIEVGE